MSTIPLPASSARRWATAAAAVAVVGAGAVGVHLADAGAATVAATTSTVPDGTRIQQLPANGDVSGAAAGQENGAPPPDAQAGTRPGARGAQTGSGGFQQAQAPGRGTGGGQAMTQGS
ncbi:MAG TPA: hypothetical protein DEH05_02625 [Propionibacteriaceae bacterium]|jgi:hypothetical protein|nr:hypothetical protein [Propionibacteriaceae bacterium]